MCMLTDEPARFGGWAALLVCRIWANGAMDHPVRVFLPPEKRTKLLRSPHPCDEGLRVLSPLSPSCTRLTAIDRRHTALYQVFAKPPPFACAKVTACLFCTSSA